MLKKLNPLCHYAYELALLLTLSVLILLPLHAKATQHFNITKVIDDHTVSFIVEHPTNIVIGDILPVYRFNPEWKTLIGQVKVSEIKDTEIICSFDPKTFYWPMGRQGQILEINGPQIKVDMGSQLGLKSGDKLILYKERNFVGKIQLTQVSENYSYATLLEIPTIPLEKITVSEFIIPTQVVFFKNKLLTTFEIFFLFFVITLQSYLFFFKKSSLFLMLGNFIKSKLQLLPKQFLHLTFNLLLCIPFIWFVINFSIHCSTYLLSVIANFLQSSVLALYSKNLNLLFSENAFIIYTIGVAGYLYVLITTQRSPILLFWNAVKFHQEKPKTQGYLKDILIWCLHLVIVYAFARTLFYFLQGNLQAMINIAWPGGNMLYVFTHAPRIDSFESFFRILRYALWSITIIGCIYGYGHSILGYIWGKKIRNLDFTVMGWITNAMCYPLLGAVLLQMIPPYKILDPIVTQGPLFYFQYILEFLLNLLYTLSIWNLGRMFGVMTDKGVQMDGFYSAIRHPSYTLEALMFVIIYMNELGSPNRILFVFLVFIVAYYIRSEREDQFMSASNPDYLNYKKQTPYKFIPGIY